MLILCRRQIGNEGAGGEDSSWHRGNHQYANVTPNCHFDAPISKYKKIFWIWKREINEENCAVEVMRAVLSKGIFILEKLNVENCVIGVVHACIFKVNSKKTKIIKKYIYTN
jgi:hypothetical protein